MNPESQMVMALPDNSGVGLGTTATFVTPPKPWSAWHYAMAAAGIIGVGLSAYHGYRRNNSVGWAIGWGLLGTFWPVAIPIALAQGFAKPNADRSGTNRSGRRKNRGRRIKR